MSTMSRGTTRFDRAMEILVIAVWAAMLTGLLHAATLGIALLRERVIFSSRDVVWMAPVAYLLVFLAPALLLAAAAMVSPRIIPLRLVVFGYVAFGVFCLLLPFTEIARVASAALAAGVGLQMARIVGAAPDRWIPRIRRQTAVLVAFVAIAGVAVHAWGPLSERRARASLADAKADAPNVLLIILDTVRSANLGLYGYSRPTTPVLSERATESVVFDRAFSTAPWTLPSHASMFTGRYASELSADWMDALDRRHPTLAEAFAASGYLTGGFVANLQYTSHDSGLDRGFQHYDDFGVSWRQLMLSSAIGQTPTFRDLLSSRTPSDALRALVSFNWHVPPKLVTESKFADQVTREFLDWQARSSDRPFFAFLNYFDAHQPVHSPPAFARRFVSESRGVDGYDAAIAYLDSELGALFEELERRNVLDETIVIVTSDHGEMWGEHELFGHAHNLYLPVLHVPLLIRYPRRLRGGTRVAAPVSLRDLAATVADLAGLSAGARFPGASLARLATDSSAGGSAVLAYVSRAPNVEPALPTSRGSMRSVIDDRFHYIRNEGDGEEQLFDYRADESERSDLASTAEGRAMLRRFRGVVPELDRAATVATHGSLRPE